MIDFLRNYGLSLLSTLLLIMQVFFIIKTHKGCKEREKQADKYYKEAISKLAEATAIRLESIKFACDNEKKQRGISYEH